MSEARRFAPRGIPFPSGSLPGHEGRVRDVENLVDAIDRGLENMGDRVRELANPADEATDPSQAAAAEDAANKADESDDADVCLPCNVPPDCEKYIEEMEKKSKSLKKELAKYDPIEDAKGGHIYYVQGVQKITVAGGHYKEIRELQQGLLNELRRFNKAKCYHSLNKRWKTTRRNADNLSSRPIRIPKGIREIRIDYFKN